MTSAFRAWEGPSPLTGAPTVLLITPRSSNTKTGPMAQAWLLLRDVEPFEALRTGVDRAICGDCVHRSGDTRTCYVSLFHGPMQIWRTLQAGKYPLITGEAAAAALAGEQLRITAYGDPALVPFEVWRTLLSRAAGSVGYTHQWQTCDLRFRSLLMASVETDREMKRAQSLGWRTFRARPHGAPLHETEFQCPASEEGGHRSTCARCQLCRGTSSPAKSVSILLHGRGAVSYSGPRAKYGGLRADLERQGAGELRLTAAERSRVMLALRMYYRRRKQTVTLKTKKIGGDLYRFWIDTMKSTRPSA